MDTTTCNFSSGGAELTVPAATKVTINGFLQVGDTARVDATFDLKDVPVEYHQLVLQMLWRSRTHLCLPSRNYNPPAPKEPDPPRSWLGRLVGFFRA